jgi:hypothetical protein
MHSLLRKISLTLLLILFYALIIHAEENTNKVFSDNIKTVLLFKTGFEMSFPVMSLGGSEELTFSFDDLDGDLKHYRYTFIHCDASWNTSTDITPTDYISGYSDEEIIDYAYSYNTMVKYTHYTLKFPTSHLQPKLSGNYLLVVFLDEPSQPVITRRFMVLEKLSPGVTGEARQANTVNGRYTRQEVDFVIHPNNMQILDPNHDLKVNVTQNDRWDNALKNLKPRFVRGDELDYNYEGEKSFNGGNEFRNFDTKSLKYNTEHIRKMEFDSGYTQVYLLDDIPRTFKNYATEKDINGRRLIKNEDYAQNSDIEADYTMVHFFVPWPAILTNGKVYLMGALTDWQLDDNSRMAYDFTRHGYAKTLLLKQGYYNYEYVLVDNKTGVADEGYFEGSHWETENEYTVWVYYRAPGGLYDRLICVQNLNTIH